METKTNSMNYLGEVVQIGRVQREALRVEQGQLLVLLLLHLLQGLQGLEGLQRLRLLHVLHHVCKYGY